MQPKMLLEQDVARALMGRFVLNPLLQAGCSFILRESGGDAKTIERYGVHRTVYLDGKLANTSQVPRIYSISPLFSRAMFCGDDGSLWFTATSSGVRIKAVSAQREIDLQENKRVLSYKSVSFTTGVSVNLWWDKHREAGTVDRVSCTLPSSTIRRTKRDASYEDVDEPFDLVEQTTRKLQACLRLEDRLPKGRYCG